MHWQGGWHGGHARVVERRYPMLGGPRTVVVGRPDPIYRTAVLIGYGPRCHVTRCVGFTLWDWHKIVTTAHATCPDGSSPRHNRAG